MRGDEQRAEEREKLSGSSRVSSVPFETFPAT